MIGLPSIQNWYRHLKYKVPVHWLEGKGAVMSDTAALAGKWTEGAIQLLKD
jgi:hypothetical protein